MAAREIRMPVKFVRIAVSAAARLYEHPLVLVRPDGIVAWCGNTLPQDVHGLLDQVRGASSVAVMKQDEA